jgi:hypothetical protein
MLQPKEVEIECQDGTKKAYVISKFPAIAGREIITQYPLSAIPKIGDYGTNESLMLKIMSYVAVRTSSGGEQRLITRELVDNHVPDYECLIRLEAAMVEYNCSFFANGRASTFFELIASKGQALLTKTLTDLSEQSLRKTKQPSANSETSTH